MSQPRRSHFLAHLSSVLGLAAFLCFPAYLACGSSPSHVAGSGGASSAVGGGSSGGASGGTTSGGASAGGTTSGGASSAGGDTTSGGALVGGSASGGADSSGGQTGVGGALAQGEPYPYGLLPSTVGDAHVASAWEYWKTNYVERCENGSARVKWDEPDKTVSEGIAYGMLAAVGNGDQELFDGFWQYYQANLDNQGLMHWKRAGCAGTKPDDNSDNAATDADIDAAMALLQAECRFDDESYGTEADVLLGKIYDYETIEQDGLRLLRPGDTFGGRDCLNASYFAPAYYRVYAERPAQSSRKAGWLKLAADTYTLLDRFAHDTTGFVPNWSDANGNTSETGPSGCNWYTDADIFGSDGIRTPFRIAVDYLWFGTPEAKSLLNKMSGFIASEGIQTIGRKFELDGAPFGTPEHSIISVGAFADAAMADSQAVLDEFALEAVTVSDHKYFPDSLRNLYLLVLAGRFHACAPEVNP
jgi:endo-1,4-beta-D-glucanase Y